jgi:subtilase family serine protease
MLLVLKRNPEQEVAMRKLLDDQQDKLSPIYHKWLMPDEFGQRFGASDQDLQIVTGWLQSHGFKIDRVTHGRTIVEFSGTESQLEDAFRTQIHKYLVNGEEHWANASDPQIPAALAPAIAGVWSLHDFRKRPNLRISPEILKMKYTPGKRPDTTLTGSNGQVIHALSPADYATIYNINPPSVLEL